MIEKPNVGDKVSGVMHNGDGSEEEFTGTVTEVSLGSMTVDRGNTLHVMSWNFWTRHVTDHKVERRTES